jgi:hypothetical protein
MRQSDSISIQADQKVIKLILKQTNMPESERIKLGELALKRFKEVFHRLPENSLMLMTYNDRATPFSPNIFVYDLKQFPQ